MEYLTSHNVMVMLLALGLMLGLARTLGELAQRFHQPAVLGELLAGVILGPTILGNFNPELGALLFPLHGPNLIALDAVATLSVVLFLMVAGIEVDLSTIWKQGRAGFKIGSSSMVIPFVMGFAAAMIIPRALGRHEGADNLVFALFFAIALSISALPVIAKTLMDLGLYRSDLGMVVVSAAVFSDLAGWIVFAIILSMMGSGPTHGNGIAMIVFNILAFAAAVLTIGRLLIHKTIPFLQKYAKWPGSVISFAIVLTLLGAAFTEWIGIHAIFGAFIVGVAIGDSTNLREHTRVILENFISYIFAPLFFASIGLKVDFAEHFDAGLVILVLAIACGCKLAGGYLGARWSGMPKWDSMAIGVGLNSRGAMEIILGLLALNAGIIRTRLFVALVVMAIATSVISGPAMKYCLDKRKKTWRLREVLSRALFMQHLKSRTHREVIEEITQFASRRKGFDAQMADGAVWAREKALNTGIGNGVAIPHAHIKGLTEPLVVVGISKQGIDFDSPDGNPAHVIFLILMPSQNSIEQLEFVPEIARIFRDPGMMERVLLAKSRLELIKLMANGDNGSNGPSPS